MRTLFCQALGDLPVGLFNSGNREGLAHHKWYIYVSPNCSAALASNYALIDYSTMTLPLLVGNSSLPFTMSGISSEGLEIAPYHGRYGFVPFFRGSIPPHNRGLNFTLYRFTLLFARPPCWP